MSTTDPSQWIKATRSSGGNNCVEMRRTDAGVEVRDSKDKEGPVLKFTAAEFAAWRDSAKLGEFDHLA